MRITFTSAAIALALATATLGSSNIAGAVAAAKFDIANVAIGYADGYYDNDHRWHLWAHRADAKQFRTAHKEQYHSWKHDDPKHEMDDK